MSPRTLAILASAYNVCGPRSGTAATPANVRALADSATLYRYTVAYMDHVRADAFALYTVAQVDEAACAIAGAV